MARTLLAIVLGVVALVLVTAGIEAVANILNPQLAQLKADPAAHTADIMARMPVAALINVLLGWTLASIAGGFVAAKISRAHERGAALAVGGIMVLLVGINVLSIPHPVWMVVLGLLLPVPMALLGRKLASI